MRRKRDWKQIWDAQGQDSVKHEWTEEAQESSSSWVVTEVKAESAPLEASMGMDLQKDPPKATVNIFLGRYFIKTIEKGKDYTSM